MTFYFPNITYLPKEERALRQPQTAIRQIYEFVEILFILLQLVGSNALTKNCQIIDKMVTSDDDDGWYTRLRYVKDPSPLMNPSKQTRNDDGHECEQS